jgi:hypothetical protein
MEIGREVAISYTISKDVAACFDSIARLPDARDYSAPIPDYEILP